MEYVLHQKLHSPMQLVEAVIDKVVAQLSQHGAKPIKFMVLLLGTNKHMHYRDPLLQALQQASTSESTSDQTIIDQFRNIHMGEVRISRLVCGIYSVQACIQH